MKRNVSQTHSRAQVGMRAQQIVVEAHLQGGAPGFTLVGLGETALRESRARVKAAIIACGLSYPNQRIVVNLAPADLAKEGARYDLAIAVSILQAAGVVPQEATQSYEFIGELGLSGEVRAVRGALSAALAAQRQQRQLVLPQDNADDVQLAAKQHIRVGHLQQVLALLREGRHPDQPLTSLTQSAPEAQPTFPAIIGQLSAKRALLVAATGGHHLIMIGPPGGGKTLLAKSLSELLPALDAEAATEVAAIYSSGGVSMPNPWRPPMRAPHHSASAVALSGGGMPVSPGEVSLAHNGVLFLDELPHFLPSVLDQLREPLESRSIEVCRANYRVSYPARFQLIAAMNPCPAGRVCQQNACRCQPQQRQRYQSRISGPLLDRLDLHVRVPAVETALLMQSPQNSNGQASLTEGRRLLQQARARALHRQGCLNAELKGGPQLATICQTEQNALDLLGRAVQRQSLSARSFHKMLKTSRTVADLDGSETVTPRHMAEALSYRAVNWEGMEAGSAP